MDSVYSWPQAGSRIRRLAVVAVPSLALTLALSSCSDDANVIEQRTYDSIHDGRLEAADYWRDQPAILSAGLGFDGIIGVPTLDQRTVEAIGGTWDADLVCTDGSEPAASLRTSAVLTTTAATFGSDTYLDDGLPVVFSWPVRTDTITPQAFRFTLNTGEDRVAVAAGTYPNWELNERNVVVLFGDLGNRGLPGEPGAEYPVRLEIVDEGTPLMLAGPTGDVSAVGLTWETDNTPYVSGPKLVGAKLTRSGSTGEGGSRILERNGFLPNDEYALYGDQIASAEAAGLSAYRIRMLTTGGFSPDGVAGVRPDEFSRYFRLHATGPDGQPTFITDTGVPVEVQGGRLEVIGLSDLGQAANPDDGIYYDDCYLEDRDNYIDVIVLGTDTAVRSLQALEIPAANGYAPFFNPGGPGPSPMPGTRYTAPGPPHLEPIIIALDEPMRIDR